MSIVAQQIVILREAATHLSALDVAPYFRLKQLLHSQKEHDRLTFRTTFAKFYGLNAGGLSETLKNRYFERLFSLRLTLNHEPPYAELLQELYEFKRRKGDQVLGVSFVSKLVAMHDESRPLYDRHVRNFFGLSKPGLGSVEFQIAGFIYNLGIIRNHYQTWGTEPDFNHLLKPLLERIPPLKHCHLNRLCDFLVWTAGRKKLGNSKPVDEV